MILGETHDTAYYGDKGQTAYSHSITTGNPHNTTYEEVGADKSGAANTALTSSKDYTDEKISEVNVELAKKALASELTIHISDKVVHITAEERKKWNAYTTQIDNLKKSINTINKTLTSLGSSVTELQNKQGYPIAKEN